MRYKQTTQVPNEVFDKYSPTLSGAELKILLTIIRQTYGWHKQRDRITYSQFMQKTGLSRRVIADSIQSLIDKRLILVTDSQKTKLHSPKLRRGKVLLFCTTFNATSAKNNSKKCRKWQKHVQNRVYNKTNNTKLNRQKVSDWDRIQEILNNRNR
jgi:phage replication O-like protein O